MSSVDAKKLVASYLRISTVNKGQSIESQRLAIEQYYESMVRRGENWEFCGEYSDEMSGKSTAKREGLQRLLKDCRHGKVDIVLCYKIDRLGRSIIDLKGLIDSFNMMKVRVIFVSQGLDTDVKSPLAGLLFNLLGVFAEFERELISERVKVGLENARKKGVILGNKPLEVSPLLYKKIIRMRGEQKSIRDISKATGISKSSVWRILSSAGYR